MKHYTEDQIARFANIYYTPKDLRIKRMVLKNQTDKNGEAMVYIRLRRYDPLKRKDSKEKRIPADVRVNPKFWSTSKGEVLKGDFDYQNKNRLIKEKESRISNYIYKPDLDYIMAQLRREEFLMIEEISPSKRLFKYKKCLVDYIEDYYNRRKKLGHPHGTIKEFKTVMNRIKRFDDSRDKKTYLPDINISWSDDFEVWLTEENIVREQLKKPIPS